MTLSKINSEQNISDAHRVIVARYSWIFPWHKYCLSQPLWSWAGKGTPLSVLHSTLGQEAPLEITYTGFSQQINAVSFTEGCLINTKY